MGTPQPVDPGPDPFWPSKPPPPPDVVVLGEAEEVPTQTSFDDLEAEAAIAAQLAPVLRALDKGLLRARNEAEAEARRIVAAAKDEAARIRKGIEDELVAAHLGLDQLRARRDEAIQELRELYDLVHATSAQLAPDPEEDGAAEPDLPEPPGEA